MWEYFKAGGPLMWPLLLCSIAALTIILERCWFWRKLAWKREEARASAMLEMIREKGAASAFPSAGPLTAMLEAGLTAPRGEEARAMEAVAIEALARMRRGLFMLDTIITASPMLGILGTMLGIISSFDMLGAVGVSDPKAVAAGIAQALITTAAGLGIAVFAIFPYNYFLARIDQAQDSLEAYGTRLTLFLSPAPEKADG